MQRIKNITKACRITDSIFEKLVKGLNKKSFKTEKDIGGYLKKEAKNNNCKLAFAPVIATEKNGAEIHHKPNKTKLKKGFLVVDFGVKYKGYCADCTRTFYIGKPSKKEKEIYELVLNAQLTALKEVKPGVYATDIDAIARATLWKYFRNFMHGVGHGIGKKIHQKPTLSPNSKAVLKKDQIVTVEPGLYFKNRFGIRIEDTVLIANKAKVLNKTKKELIVI